jgi:hypothetical protein
VPARCPCLPAATPASAHVPARLTRLPAPEPARVEACSRALPASRNPVCGRHLVWAGIHHRQALFGAGILCWQAFTRAGIDHWQASSGGRHFRVAGIYCIGWVGSKTSDPIKPH